MARGWISTFLLATVLLSAGVARAQDPAAPPLVVPPPSPPFEQWLAEFKQEAAEQGIRPAVLEAAFTGVQPIPRIIELDRKQPERTITFAQYQKNIVTAKRVADGKKLLREHKALLAEVSKKYGVQPRFLVALLGIETNYGRNTGGYRVVDALATLAHDGRRAAYFRRELLAALTILDRHNIEPDTLKGSWAGAMGQDQFMPSAYLKYAQDWDGDGRPDLWKSQGDVFASAANYLSTVGWNNNLTWGREVRLPAGASVAGEASLDPAKGRKLGDWHALGVRRADGKKLPKGDHPAWLVLPDGPAGKAFLVYENYRTVMDWNRSTYFATSVGLLADRIGEG